MGGRATTSGKHERDECDWTLVKCRYVCGESISRRQLAEHEQNLCQQRPMNIKLVTIVKNMEERYRPLRQLITSCYLSVICRKTGARRRCSGGQDGVLSTFASFRDDFEHRPAHF